MRWYANELGHGDEADFWALVGLLHDVDFEQWPEPVSYTHLDVYKRQVIERAAGAAPAVGSLLGVIIRILRAQGAAHGRAFALGQGPQRRQRHSRAAAQVMRLSLIHISFSGPLQQLHLLGGVLAAQDSTCRGQRTHAVAVRAVSYTHLDVYKRQLYGNAPRMPHARRVRKHTRRTARGPCFVQAQYMQGVLVQMCIRDSVLGAAVDVYQFRARRHKAPASQIIQRGRAAVHRHRVIF